MKIIKNIKRLVSARVLSALFISLLVGLFTGCSSSSTNSSIGLSVGGSWHGTLHQNNRAIASFTLSLSQVSEDSKDPFSGSTLKGVLTSSNNCILGGTVEGTLSGTSINLIMTSPIGKLNLTGSANSASMGGSWFNAAE
ncbi:MAG: hypothetical protein V3V09_07385, partial [Arenicellales bacterium]